MGKTQNLSDLSKATQINSRMRICMCFFANPTLSPVSQIEFYFGILSKNIRELFWIFFLRIPWIDVDWIFIYHLPLPPHFYWASVCHHNSRQNKKKSKSLPLPFNVLLSLALPVGPDWLLSLFFSPLLFWIYWISQIFLYSLSWTSTLINTFGVGLLVVKRGLFRGFLFPYFSLPLLL